MKVTLDFGTPVAATLKAQAGDNMDDIKAFIYHTVMNRLGYTSVENQFLNTRLKGRAIINEHGWAQLGGSWYRVQVSDNRNDVDPNSEYRVVGNKGNIILIKKEANK